MESPKLLITSALFSISLFTSHLVSAQSYKKLHQNAVVVDTHNDVLISVLEGLKIEDDLRGKTHSDLARFKEGGVDVQFFSVWCDESYGEDTAFKFANEQIDSLDAIIARNPGKMMKVRTPAELNAAVKQKRLASLVGVEGGHMIEHNLKYLDSLYSRGVRYMTLTWNNSTSWASSAMDEAQGTVPNPEKGLNDFGKQVVQRMNDLGMMVDLSHVGEQTFWDAINTTSKPVLVSHSCVYNICSHFRNLKDDQIKAVAKNGGVIQLNFYSGFLDCNFNDRLDQFIQKHQTEIDSLNQQNKSSIQIWEWMEEEYPEEAKDVRPPLSLLMDHLEYIINLVGVDYVGLGSDFDGITSAPQQLDGVEDLPVITREFVARGYSKQDINKILGGNLLRVFQANSK
ncbi:dipeptidase [Pontibacter silvestris]|uniref:Dipeptidase n=1 Tax=Pontibacter silvestris TaxID=2305183 RepID=A0ABW4X340_9BACT|nr:dipeptidase [Pontibacter silvestris]MCC9134947.1 dipeptidase [Pontibacter silvestris]